MSGVFAAFGPQSSCYNGSQEAGRDISGHRPPRYGHRRTEYSDVNDPASSAKRAVVTGAAGFIGSHLVDRLLAEGYRVVGIDSFEDYYPRFLKEANLSGASTSPAFSLIGASLLDLAEQTEPGEECSRLQRLLRDADVVYHLAAQAGVRASWGRSFEVYTRNNVLATQLLLESAKDAGLSKFVYASSSSVYGDSEELPLREDGVCRPVSPYGVTKLAGEHLAVLYAKSQGVPTVSLRFFTVYGPRQRPDMAFNIFLRALQRDEPLGVFGDGDQTRDFTYISDIVNALVLALGAPPGSVFNLGGGSRVSLHDVLAIMAQVAGATPRVELRPTQAGDVRHTWADLERARSLLGYDPKVSLETGLRAEWEWLAGVAAGEATASRG
jgi:nucleoside-diphosphate-sugar epimerase